MMTSSPRTVTILNRCSLATGQHADRDDNTFARYPKKVIANTRLHYDAYSCLSLLPLTESIKPKGTIGSPSAQCTYSDEDQLLYPRTVWLRACSPTAQDIPPTRMRAGQPPKAATRCFPNAEDIPPTKMGAGSPPEAATRHIPAGATTLVVRNVSKEHTLRELLEEWAPDGSFNLVYYPYNMKSQRRLGYCFINFTSHGSALEFAKARHGKPFPGGEGGKVLDITGAKFQGVAETLELFRGKKIELMTDPEFLPAVFVGTQRQDVRKILLNLGLITMPSPEDGSVRI